MKFLRKAFSSNSSPLAEKIQAEKYICNFLDGTGGIYDWDDFISIPFSNSEIEEIRLFCCSTDQLFPPDKKESWCNDDGLKAMRAIQLQLKSEIEKAKAAEQGAAANP